MSTRGILVLAVALAVFALLALLGQREGAPEPAGPDAKLLPELADTLNDIDEITLVKGGNQTIATLERGSGGWTVAEKSDYPADVAKIRKDLRALAEARILEPKTSNPELYGRLGVEDVEHDTASGIAVLMSGAARKHATVIVGDQEGSDYRYVRLGGDARSYLIDRDLDLPGTAAQWLAPEIVDLRGPRVRQVTISHADGETVRIFKNERTDSNYTVADVPEGRELRYPGVANVIGDALRELRLEDVEPAAGESAADMATVEFRTFDGLIVTVRGFERNDESWLTFEAAFSAEPAAAGDSAENQAGDAAENPSGETNDASAPDPEREAAEINARVTGWRYRIATYQYDQMTRRVADLLKPPADQ